MASGFVGRRVDVIVAEGIVKSLGDARVLDHVSVAIPQGMITAVIGPNGAGKSTLLSVIAGISAPDEGHCAVGGIDTGQAPVGDVTRTIALLPQDDRAATSLTVRQLVAFARQDLVDTDTGPSAGDDAHVARAIAYMRLEPLLDRPVDTLPGGLRRRALLAMALARDTEYLLLDEPLGDLDPGHAIGVMRLLRNMAFDQGKTIVMVLSDLTMAATYAQYCVALRAGTVLAQGPTPEVMDSDLLSELFEWPLGTMSVSGRRLVVPGG